MAQAKVKESVPFTYTPDPAEDIFNSKLPDKALTLNQKDLILLNKKSASAYAVERYNTDLKKVWSASVPLAGEETIETFFTTPEAVIVITRRTDGQGTQQLHGHQINLTSGALNKSTKLLEAPAAGRRAGVAVSADGSKMLVYRYHTDSGMQIKSISGTLFDSHFSNLKDVNYYLGDMRNILSADIQVSNSGEQYVSLISDQMQRLTVRQYPVKNTDAKVMSVLVGGRFNGKLTYILDSKYKLMPSGQLFGTVLTADEATGMYQSLKVIKFDFDANDMIFAKKFKFTPDYLQKINAAYKDGANKASRLEDIYFSDLILTPDNKLIIIAEKKFTAGGEDAPFFARELHLFAYDEYMTPAWNSVLVKQQEAPAAQGYSGISYRYSLHDNTLSLVTLEELNGKYDLYLRRINTATGQMEAPVALGLNIAKSGEVPYVKSYTAWFTDKDMVAVTRPAKKPGTLQLNRILIK